MTLKSKMTTCAGTFLLYYNNTAKNNGHINLMATKNIIYRTTKNWNPGDEFIYLGVHNLIAEVIGEHNNIIFNCNPDVRQEIGMSQDIRNIKLPYALTEYPELNAIPSVVRIGFYDNSIKFDSDMSYADFAVLAGTPEWNNPRVYNFYDHLLKNNIPLISLGVGTMDEVPDFIGQCLEHSPLLTCRDENQSKHATAVKYGFRYVPCPALCAIRPGKEKQVKEVKKIALGLGVPLRKSVIFNSIDDHIYEWTASLYHDLIQNYPQYEFVIISHYIDEIAFLKKEFPNTDILYSFDGNDYPTIFKKFDFVISTRVHGCGLAASLGIPSINIAPDYRAGTCHGFLAPIVEAGHDKQEFIKLFTNSISNVAKLSKELSVHKKKVWDTYISLLHNALDNIKRPDYGTYHIPYIKTDFKNVPKIMKIITENYHNLAELKHCIHSKFYDGSENVPVGWECLVAGLSHRWQRKKSFIRHIYEKIKKKFNK